LARKLDASKLSYLVMAVGIDLGWSEHHHGGQQARWITSGLMGAGVVVTMEVAGLFGPNITIAVSRPW
jgi:hypothetical protein